MSKLPIVTQKFTGDYSKNNIYNVEPYNSDDWSYTDFYILGHLWVDALRTALVGVEILPAVHAAAKEVTPAKPAAMKPSELPLYESPHAEYKECLLEKEKCPKYQTKIAQEYLYPKVKSLRKDCVAFYTEKKKDFIAKKDELKGLACEKAGEAVEYMRRSDQYELRVGLVALGTLSGFCFGGRLLTKRLFFASVGALATGALCFPRETDEVFRDVAFRFGKLAGELFSLSTGQNFRLRDNGPIACVNELPDDK